jgi:hypothetical protein
MGEGGNLMNPQKSKGDRAELEVQALIREQTGWPARRKLGAGRSDDMGDIDGVPSTVISVKNYKDIGRAIRDAMRDLPDQQKRAKATFACAWIRLLGGRYIVVMTPEMWATYAREAVAIPRRGEGVA